MTLITDTDAARRMRAARNAALFMTGVTAAGFASETLALFVLTINCLVWLLMGMAKAEQVKSSELVEGEAVKKEIARR